MDSLNLVIISAMYENGGNTLHRHLDGHPELLVYPFESQLGTPLCNDYLSSLFPFKYRWPEFPLMGNPSYKFKYPDINAYKIKKALEKLTELGL
ncbi:MAG: hypothetical protein NC918_00060 [Candidatus Omnitrophica bacterium]|nr:hypothetical protein [Candidatus Omnitrophota bacterium]